MGVLWRQQGETSPPPCNSWREKPFWSLTVHFINQVSLRAGLEGLAFPPSWAWHWDALGGLPPHYFDQQLQPVIAGDGQTLWALFGLMSGCSNPSGLESQEGNSLGILGNAWDRQMSLHPCAALLGSLPVKGKSLAWRERMDPAMDRHWTGLCSVLAFKGNETDFLGFHFMSSVFWYMTNTGNNKEIRKSNQLGIWYFFFSPVENPLRWMHNVFDKLQNILSGWYPCRNWLNCVIATCSTINCNHM